MARYISWIDEANTRISIVEVLRGLEIFVPETIVNGGNKKIFCPFGFYHSDNGATRAMRIYMQSNTCYCFSCAKRYSPVSLAAAAWDRPWITTALKLLEDSGYKEKTIEQRWQEATTDIVVKPNILDLAEALKIYCARIDKKWTLHQLDEDISSILTKCLNLLNAVHTDEDALKWLEACKSIMHKKLVDTQTF